MDTDFALYNFRYINYGTNTLLSDKLGCKCFMDNNRCFRWYDKGFPSKDSHNKVDIC